VCVCVCVRAWGRAVVSPVATHKHGEGGAWEPMARGCGGAGVRGRGAAYEQRPAHRYSSIVQKRWMPLTKKR
jgi:hypothetical protein